MLTNKLTAMRAEKDADDRGFTLIELLVVVVIIGILIAIAIPLYLNYQKGAKDKAAQSDIRAAVSAYQQCYTDNNNAYVLEAAVTHTTSYSLTCNGTSEGVNLSGGTSLLVTATATSVTMSASNSGGHDSTATGNLGGKKTYAYDSASGGAIN
jgi:type IV pilus assembly protein PilA